MSDERVGIFWAPTAALIGANTAVFFENRVNHRPSGFNRVFDWLTSIYTSIVGVTLRVSAVMLLIYGGLLYLTYETFMRSPTGFIPTQDKGYLLLNVQLPDSAALEMSPSPSRSQSTQLPAESMIASIPQVMWPSARHATIGKVPASPRTG